ncbi:MAG: zinc-dependent metalloprotease [Acidobacteriota bacterium]|nr:zinc-dependent metalloprotease [Acidobacteriota bacterium]
MWFLLTLFLMTDKPAQPFAQGKQQLDGFYDLYWDEAAGALYLAIDRWDEPFLLVESLATGLGSNDLGLDRGQLGRSRIVHFHRVGKRVFLVQPNLDYRANSDNALERRAVAESFATATLWGTKIVAEEDGTAYVDLKTLVFRDEKKIAERLAEAGEGGYSLDLDRGYYYKPRTKSFPDNTEIEVSLTWKGKAAGKHLPTVAPTRESVTMRQHFSMVRLPDDNFKPRAFHPRSGGIPMKYRDYAVPLDAELDQLLLLRHRLVRKNPKAKRSRLVEPLVYYVDSGAPPQIRDALIDGASWWNEAFEAAGIIDGFRVEVLPADADPMDVRYNVIQWVHRSTRGWSYGGSVIDPRTGEIIKGHVTLGSLRVRQDRLLFEGMIPFDENGVSSAPEGQRPVDLALARIRQLSAHEVGHTIGLAHNFAASNNGRASVMDYPAPLVTLEDGKLDFSQVYGVGIGEWDKISTRYLYQEFKDEKAGLAGVLADAEKQGLRFVSDGDSRAPSSMHADSHLWDNGKHGVDELARVLTLRNHLLANFSHRNLHPGKMAAQLEEVLVPVYLHHRYQLLAGVKSVGGADFDYWENTGKPAPTVTPRDRQERALQLALSTLNPEFLDLPEHLRGVIPPRPPGYDRHRELFAGRTAPAFDELALAETAADMTLQVLLQTERLNRVHAQSVNDPEQLGIDDVLEALLEATIAAEPKEGRAGAIHRQVNYLTANHLVRLVRDTGLREEVRAHVYGVLDELIEEEREVENSAYETHYTWLTLRIEENLDEDSDYHRAAKPLKTPPGSPIGCGSFH